MNKQTITFTASEQTLTKTGGIEHYASNIVSYIEASFTLGDNWAGYDSIRAVWESGYARIATVLDANNKCIVPAEVLTYKSKVNVNLVGSIVENTVLTDRLTTYPILALTVDADARVDSSETTPVTASQFEQFVDVVRDEASAIQNYTYDSEAWAVGQRAGVDVPSTDETYHNNAKYYADQGATLQQEVTDLKSEINNISVGTETFGFYSAFKACGLWHGGNVSSEKYRATSQSVMTFDRDINIRIASGYRIRFNWFVDGVYSSESSWFEGTYPLAKGTVFKIVIAKTSATEDTTSTADVPTFVEAVKFESANGYELAKHEDGYNNIFSGALISSKFLGEFVRGGINNGAIYTPEHYRITNKDILYADRDIECVASSGFRLDYIKYASDDTYLGYNGWAIKHRIPKGTYYRLLIARTTDVTSEYADVDEFANAVKVTSLFSNVARSVDGTNLATQSDLVKGTFENDHLNSSETKRARTGYIYVTQPSVLTVVPNDDYYWVVKGSNVNNGVLQNVDLYFVPSWNNEAQTLILQKGVYVVVVANGSTYSSSTAYDPSNPSIRFSIDALSLAEALNASIGVVDNDVLTSKYPVTLPNYWEEYMETKLPLIEAQVRESAMNGDSFVFFTDYHIEHNSGKSHLLINRILNNTPINRVVFGGDIFNGSTTKEETLSKCQDFAQRFRKLPMYGIRGNHEYNENDGGSVSVKLSENEIYNYLIKNCESDITSTGKMYYYIDNAPQKIRYYFLDTKNMYGYGEYPIDNEQLAWLSETLASLSSEWNVVVFSHQFWGHSGGSWFVNSLGEQIVTAIQNSNTAATVCAIISGHVHEDHSEVVNGVAYIATTWDGYYADANKALGTTTELAFDIFTLDTSAKTIKTIRVGQGSNRSWTYGV